MAKALGKRVELGVPVRGITQKKGGVQVHADGLEVHAKRVIVAIPPTLTGQIEYHPALPVKRAQLVQRMPQGSLIKAEAIYPTRLLARREPVGPGGLGRRPRTHHLRLESARRQARRDARLRRGPRRARVGGPLKGGTPCRGAQELRRLLRAEGAQAEELLRAGLEQGGLDPRLPGGLHRPRRAVRVRTGPAPRRRDGSTGPAPRRPPSGWGTWTAPCARASVPRAKFCAADVAGRRGRTGARRRGADPRRRGRALRPDPGGGQGRVQRPRRGHAGRREVRDVVAREVAGQLWAPRGCWT